MINKLTLRNFKSVGEQVYEFTRFDLLVGRNNSGKSTVLQAMAIWQFCVDEFHRSKRTGTTGIQVVLPNFTALPVPEFILLWKDRTDRNYPADPATGKKKQEFVLIEILLEWQDAAGKVGTFGVQLRYHSPQTMYAIPSGGWSVFRECESAGSLPRIAYVPPFSGLEPTEKFLDISPMRQQVGKGQPGSVLRNLLLRVSSPSPRDNGDQAPRRAPSAVPVAHWQELAGMVDRWFSVKIGPPRYESTKDVYITVEYTDRNRSYDIISGGSGFHQTLTLMAFLFGYQPTTILLDEPDAHLHVNLQREILDYFKRKSQELGTQFLIATHAEEFARGVDASQIVSLLDRKPKRVESTPAVLQAMADVSNEEITRLMASPYIMYVEGESDERTLRAWAGACGGAGGDGQGLLQDHGWRRQEEHEGAGRRALQGPAPDSAECGPPDALRLRRRRRGLSSQGGRPGPGGVEAQEHRKLPTGARRLAPRGAPAVAACRRRPVRPVDAEDHRRLLRRPEPYAAAGSYLAAGEREHLQRRER
jgi:hypothetical protein